MARTEEQLRAYYGKHPEGGKRCTDLECVQCEFRDLFERIDRLSAYLLAVCAAYERVTTERHLLEPVCQSDEDDLARLDEHVRAAKVQATPHVCGKGRAWVPINDVGGLCMSNICVAARRGTG